MIVWKLGHYGKTPQDSLIPTKDSIEKFKKLLETNGRTGDLVWGPGVNVEVIPPNKKINIDCKLEDSNSTLLYDLLDELSNARFDDYIVEISIKI